MIAKAEGYLIGLVLLVLAALGAYEWAKSAGAAQVKAEVAAVVAKSAAEAAATESSWKESAHVLSLARASEDRSIDTRYQSDLARLRTRAASRPNVPQAPASAASGGSGSGLPDRDGELARLAARANKLRAALGEAQQWIKAVTAPVHLP